MGQRHRQLSAVLRPTCRRQETCVPSFPSAPILIRRKADLCVQAAPLNRTAAMGLGSPRFTSICPQKLSALQMRPRCRIDRTRRGIADIDAAVAPHGMHDHRHLAYHSDTSLAMTAALGSPSPQVVSLSLPRNRASSPRQLHKACGEHRRAKT